MVESSEDLIIKSSSFVDLKDAQLKDIYKLGNPLGDGAFGIVRRGVHKKTGAIRAIKTLSKSSILKSKEAKKFFIEVEILKTLDHPNIARLFEFQQDDKYYHLVMELCTGGELFDAILEAEKFSEKRAAKIIHDLLSAVNYMHIKGIVHRDLKPENLLLENDKNNCPMKLIDFGTARIQQDVGVKTKKMNEKLGSAQYIAPEVIKRNYDSKCDLWSAGVILYVLLCGYPPFNGDSDDDIMKVVARGKFQQDKEDWDSIGNDAKDLINKMLVMNPKNRLSASDALTHPWIQKWLKSEAPEAELLNKTLGKLKKFRTNQRLAKATWTQIASQLTTEKDKEALTKTFKALDINNDGKLSREELVKGYTKMQEDQSLAELEVDHIMSEVDVDKSGYLDYTEFVAATMSKDILLNNKNLENAFSLFDKDGSGKISTDELKFILGGEQNFKEDQWKSIIQEVDKNNDGEIDLKEFKDMMKNINQ